MEAFMKRFLLLLICVHPAVWAADIFSDPKNLKVLDEDITPVELRNTMRMFSQSLGVRCQHCHVGEAGQPLSEFDFAADDKAAKDKARFMLKMVQDLNHHLVTGIKDRSVKVQCITCHRGAALPIQTVDLLKNTLDEQGVDGALAKHDELKAQYYGSHTHDFTENTLLNLATHSFATDPVASQKILLKNLTMHPKGVQTLVTLGEYHAAQKDLKTALDYFNQANAIQPNPWLAQKIKGLQEQL